MKKICCLLIVFWLTGCAGGWAGIPNNVAGLSAEQVEQVIVYNLSQNTSNHDSVYYGPFFRFSHVTRIEAVNREDGYHGIVRVHMMMHADCAGYKKIYLEKSHPSADFEEMQTCLPLQEATASMVVFSSKQNDWEVYSVGIASSPKDIEGNNPVFRFQSKRAHLITTDELEAVKLPAFVSTTIEGTVVERLAETKMSERVHSIDLWGMMQNLLGTTK